MEKKRQKIRSTVNDIVIYCVNYGEVTSRKDCAGGITGLQELGLIYGCEGYGGVKLLDMAYLGSAVYLSVLRELRAGVKIFLVFISIPCSFSMISYMYYKYSDLDDIEFEFVDIDEGSARVNRIIYAVVLALSIVLDIIYIIGSFNNNPFERVAIFHNTDITAHRGASVDAPENTLAAFSKAIEDMADVIELDVQMTKDGYIVVMHDTSAYRTTGVLKNITELTLREVKRLDAGYWYSEEYKGEKSCLNCRHFAEDEHCRLDLYDPIVKEL